jgi:hypothetical protein
MAWVVATSAREGTSLNDQIEPPLKRQLMTFHTLKKVDPWTQIDLLITKTMKLIYSN